ncbi:MAG: phosphonate C-P lyase system protein PhnG, partial [Spirochaetales bacterium]|jgi:alpha-D-ribose 1-methylphosphonate 5-triphosphate synthase subunit PhnG|nr:phosphonate C-P lyase system protein PhnG [Spirochaetales bacterium]
MDKITLSRITAFARADDLRPLAQKAAAGKNVAVLKEPEKTMVLLQVREPVKQSCFFLGELLAVQCTVEVDGARGAAVQMGDDLSKVLDAAVLDAVHSGGCEAFAAIEPGLLRLEEERKQEEARQAAQVRRTRVRFHVLEDREIEERL